jgi:hypothetical protein
MEKKNFKLKINWQILYPIILTQFINIRKLLYVIVFIFQYWLDIQAAQIASAPRSLKLTGDGQGKFVPYSRK